MANKHYNESDLVFAPLNTDPRFIDISGQRFGRLLVIGYAGIIKTRSHWWCRCDCGNITKSVSKNLRRGGAKSCGVCIERYTTHKMTGTKLYWVYAAIKDRCKNPNNKQYKDYGERGIQLSLTFEEFVAELGPKPSPQHSVDRIDNNLGYQAGNLRWATREQQAINTRRNVWLTYRGETKTASEWGHDQGFPPSLVSSRKRLGWCDECCITIPYSAGTHCGTCVHKG